MTTTAAKGTATRTQGSADPSVMSSAANPLTTHPILTRRPTSKIIEAEKAVKNKP